MSLTELGSSALSCAQVVAAVFMFASCLPHKEPEGARRASVLILFVAWSALISIAMPIVMTSDKWLPHGIFWILTLVVALISVLLIFDATLPAALYCATAGYTLQNLISGVGTSLYALLDIPDTVASGGALNMIVPYVVIYIIVYKLFIKPKITQQGLELMQLNAMSAILLVVFLGVILYDVIIKRLFTFDIAVQYLVAIRLSHVALCIFVLMLEYELLYSRNLKAEIIATEQTMQAQREQYQLSRETIDAINIKCHDIRHQIRTLASGTAAVDPAVLAEIEQAVSVYDSSVHTGNEPLDLILSEKGLICNREHISLACIADGEALSFMAPADIYALLGNAVDNAIEAAKQVPSEEFRSISIVVRRVGDTAIVHVENYFEGELTFAGDLPETTKQDKQNHGFGMKSMRSIAERYGGALHTRTQGNVFHLNISMPIQTSAKAS